MIKIKSSALKPVSLLSYISLLSSHRFSGEFHKISKFESFRGVFVVAFLTLGTAESEYIYLEAMYIFTYVSLYFQPPSMKTFKRKTTNNNLWSSSWNVWCLNWEVASAQLTSTLFNRNKIIASILMPKHSKMSWD